MERNTKLYACLTKQPTHQYIIDTYGEGKVINLHPARAAFMNGKKWPNGSTIKIGFLKNKILYNGQQVDSQWSSHKQQFTKHIITEHIAPLVNLDFKWNVPIEEADVRISFNENMGAWCYLGTDCLHITNPKTPTLNLGWIDDNEDYDDISYKGSGVVILHEFGHLLGMIHEHSRADAKLEWDKNKVYSTLGGPPNDWSKEDCNEQIFDQVKLSSFNGSVYDKNSVMEYYFPNDFFKNRPNLPKVNKLSRLDKIWMNKEYPGKPLPDLGQSGPEVGDDDNDDDGNKSWFEKNWAMLLVICVACILGLIFYYR